MNPVLIVTHNCLAQTQRCVASIEAQDIPTRLLIIDNGSTDGTVEWLTGRDSIRFNYNAGFSKGVNTGLHILFADPRTDYVLCLNNDTVVPPWFYSELLSYDMPFVTGLSMDNMESIAQKPGDRTVIPHPDFSTFLIRRRVWNKVGPFNERMKNYASDCAFHIFAHRRGIPLVKTMVPYYHERSSTLHNAPPDERVEIFNQANLDRDVFRRMFGFTPGEPAYSNAFSPDKFGIDL